jgi:hypothetical protein
MLEESFFMKTIYSTCKKNSEFLNVEGNQIKNCFSRCYTIGWPGNYPI